MNLKSLFLTACVLVGGMLMAKEAAEPIMRVGFLTDTHLTRKMATAQLSRQAFEVFKERKVEMVVHLGDLADYAYPQAYRNYRQVFDEVFTGAKPREIYLYAYHDRLAPRDGKPTFEDMQNTLKGNDFYDSFELKGYQFLVFPQDDEEDTRYRAMLESASKKSNGKPFFVFDHEPAYNTTYHTMTWGSPWRRPMMNKYPNAIVIGGHTHGSLRNELLIWQGEFTAVNAGCLQTWQGPLVGTAAPSKKAAGVLIMELFKDKVVFRRILLPSKQEYRAEKPWTIPLPFDPSTAPYNNARRAKESPAPQFKAGSAIDLKLDTPFRKATVTFPEAVHPDGTFLYRIDMARKDAKGNWEKFARQDAYGQFHLDEDKRTGTQTVTLSDGYFDAGKEYQLIVTPENFFGGDGKPLIHNFTAPAKAPSKVVYETANPMSDCQFMNGLTGGEKFKIQDGWYIKDAAFNSRLEFPAGAWNAPDKAKLRFTIDMRIQMAPSQVEGWNVVLRNPKPRRTVNDRITTPCGKGELMRMIIDFNHRQNDHYYLLIRGVADGKIRFEHVKIEILD